MLPKGLEIIEIALARSEAGLLFTPLNTALTPSEITAIVDHSGTSLLIVHERFASLLEDDGAKVAAHVRTVSIGEIEGISSLELLRSTQPNTTPEDLQSGGLFAYSSGTTVKPKGIRRTSVAGDPWLVASEGAVFGRAFDFRPLEDRISFPRPCTTVVRTLTICAHCMQVTVS